MSHALDGTGKNRDSRGLGWPYGCKPGSRSWHTAERAAAAGGMVLLMLGWSVLEGAGAALIMPAIVALVASNFARDQRPRAYGLVASAGAIASAARPATPGVWDLGRCRDGGVRYGKP